jgi:hypothetical protein
MHATTSGPGGLEWATVDACTLPTGERPLRLAEFDDLFATILQSIERSDNAHARLLLAGDEALVERTQRLAQAENSGCSLFTFAVSALEGGLVAFDVEAPPAYADVLAGLVARAEAALRQAS